MKTWIISSALGLAVVISAVFLYRPTIAPSTTSSGIISRDSTSQTTLRSAAFADDGLMPSKYTCDGANVVPPLSWGGVPTSSKSLVLIMDDPDASSGTWNHWVMFNIASSTPSVAEGHEPPGVHGSSSAGNRTYSGPCPPSGEHHYVFHIYAVDTMLNLPEGSSKSDVLSAIQAHVIDQATLTARYARPKLTPALLNNGF